MSMLRRPLSALLIAALFALAATSVAGAAATGRIALDPSAPATVKVRACKSAAYYAGRNLTFRTKIQWQDLAVAQKIRVRLDLYRKLNEASKYHKLKLPKISGWRTPDNKAASLYQYDWIIDDVETAASYRVKAVFEWRDPVTDQLQQRRTTWSKVCKQRTALPKLRITKIVSTPVAGSSFFTHVITVANIGASEAVDVPVRVFVDGYPKTTGEIDSIGPKQTVDLPITAPVCANYASAAVQRTPALDRGRIVNSTQTPILTCR
ncbi:MAG: hypothetical protein QM648_03505 [Solirubrobacterales bacterium]